METIPLTPTPEERKTVQEFSDLLEASKSLFNGLRLVRTSRKIVDDGNVNIFERSKVSITRVRHGDNDFKIINITSSLIYR